LPPAEGLLRHHSSNSHIGSNRAANPALAENAIRPGKSFEAGTESGRAAMAEQAGVGHAEGGHRGMMVGCAVATGVPLEYWIRTLTCRFRQE
jgi:hypothetical protein